MKSNWILSAIFVGVFIVSSAVGVSELIKEHTFLSRAELDDGTITDYQVDASGKSVDFCPIIDFTTQAGEPQEYEGADCKNHPEDIIIGQHVQVRFDPQEPDRFQTDQGSIFYDYLDVSFPFFFGLLFLAIAGLMVALNLRQMATARRLAGAAPTFAPTPDPYQPAADPYRSATAGTDASLEAQAASLKAQTERLQAQEAELERKIQERRQKGQ